MPRRTIITLCGSTRFRDDFYRISARYQLQGYIVLMPSVWGHLDWPDENWTDENPIKRELISLHRDMIDMSDYILVIDPGGYIGDSTRDEIQFAHRLNKPVVYMSALD